MEAIFELLGALVAALAQAVFGVLEALVAFLVALIEFFVVAITKGRSQASKRYKERRSERMSRNVSIETGASSVVEAKTDAEDPCEAQKRTEHSDSRSAVLVASVCCVFALIAFFYILRYRIREARIADSRASAEKLAGEFVSRITAHDAPNLAAGDLDELDSWGSQYQLFVDDLGVGTLVVVRSPGPDAQSGTPDDILAIRFASRTARGFGKHLLGKAFDVAKEKIENLVPDLSPEAIREAINSAKPARD